MYIGIAYNYIKRINFYMKKKRILSQKIKRHLEKKKGKNKKNKHASCVQLRSIYYQVNKIK